MFSEFYEYRALQRKTLYEHALQAMRAEHGDNVEPLLTMTGFSIRVQFQGEEMHVTVDNNEAKYLRIMVPVPLIQDQLHAGTWQGDTIWKIGHVKFLVVNEDRNDHVTARIRNVSGAEGGHWIVPCLLFNACELRDRDDTSTESDSDVEITGTSQADVIMLDD
jgi:hypothetical protein